MIESQPPSRPSNVWKWVLLIGCSVLLLTLGTCAGLGFFVWKWGSQMVFTDPARVVALAGEVVPGAAPPPGYSGFMGMDLAGFRMAAMAPTEQGHRGVKSIILMELPVDAGEFTMEEGLEELERRGVNRGSERVLESSTVTMEMGGREVAGVQQVVDRPGGRVDRRMFLLRNPAHRPVMVLLQSPEGQPDEVAWEEFGAGLRLEGFDAMRVPQGSAGAVREPEGEAGAEGSVRVEAAEGPEGEAGAEGSVRVQAAEGPEGEAGAEGSVRVEAEPVPAEP